MSCAHDEGRLDFIKLKDDEGRHFLVRIAANGCPLAKLDHSGKDEANARRMTACWNACEGVTTDMLESVPGLLPAMLPYRVMRQHNAKLLEAAQAAWNHIAELRPTQARVELARMLQEVIECTTGAQG